MSLETLDKDYRLTPWLHRTHSDIVAGRYGSMLENKEKAEEYRLKYVEKEKEADEAYVHQQELMTQSMHKLGEPPQVLADIEKIPWDPRERFGSSDKTKKVDEVKTEKLTESAFKLLKAGEQKDLVKHLVEEASDDSNEKKRVALYFS